MGDNKLGSDTIYEQGMVLNTDDNPRANRGTWVRGVGDVKKKLYNMNTVMRNESLLLKNKYSKNFGFFHPSFCSFLFTLLSTYKIRIRNYGHIGP